jgi:MFS family permease
MPSPPWSAASPWTITAPAWCWPVAAISWSLSIGTTALASGFAVLYAARVLLGVSEGPSFPALTGAVSHWLSPHERATALSYALLAVPPALAIGGSLCTELLGWLDWRLTFAALSAFWLPFGAPVEAPPCIRQRPFAIAADLHGLPLRVRAPQRMLRAMGKLLCMALYLASRSIPSPGVLTAPTTAWPPACTCTCSTVTFPPKWVALRPAALGPARRFSRMPYGSKLYHCSTCGAVLPNEPKPVLQHQMSHVRRRPYTKSGPAPGQTEHESQPAGSDSQSPSWLPDRVPEFVLIARCNRVAPAGRPTHRPTCSRRPC